MSTTSAKTALVTGASAGLGRDLAALFARDGHDVVLVARRKDRLEQLATELHDTHGVNAHVMPADLADPEAPARLLEQTTTAGIDVDFLVNNAGFGSTGTFIEQPVQRELDMVTVNVSALLHLSRLYAPAMVERGFGRILNLGSTAGFQAGPYMATYYASKAFVNHFSEAMAHELMGTGVTVTVSCPGPVATEFGGIAGNDKVRMFKGGGASSMAIATEAYNAMHKGKRMIIHGVKFKVLMQTNRLSPRRMVHAIAARMNKP